MKLLRASLSVFLASALILSSIGFSVSRHYCLGMLEGESFFHLGNETCGMEASSDLGCVEEGTMMSTHCCEDQNLSIPGVQVQNREPETDQQGLNHTFSLGLPHFISMVDTGNLFGGTRTYNHGPPKPTAQSGRNILIQQQRFLI